ncbi:MAG: GNAT family N-acetyltransferase [Pseudomonadales bacterium]|nr:GNAT family N-acetyltransferase [Pseudomonadales bacterium]
MRDFSFILKSPEDISPKQIDHWDYLAAHSNTPDPQSCGPAWQLTAFANSRRRNLPILFLQNETSQTVFSIQEAGEKWLLEPLEAHWEFGSPMLGPEALQLFEDAITELFQNEMKCTITVEIAGLSPDDVLLNSLRSRALSMSPLFDQDPAVFASLDGGLEGWLSRRSRCFRKALRKAQLCAKEQGITFERLKPENCVEVSQLYGRMLDVETRSWKGPLKTGLFSLTRFYRELLGFYAERGAARVVMAVKDGIDIGFCFGGESHGIYRGQQTSFDERFKSLSIGTQMHAETAAWLSELGATIQHFGPLQDVTHYKTNLCEVSLESVRADFILRL